MLKPIIDLSKDWQQPTSVKEDSRFDGHDWKVFTPGSLIKGNRRAPSADDAYFKIPESLVKSANVAVVYEGMAMLLPHDTLPAYQVGLFQESQDLQLLPLVADQLLPRRTLALAE